MERQLEEMVNEASQDSVLLHNSSTPVLLTASRTYEQIDSTVVYSTATDELDVFNLHSLPALPESPIAELSDDDGNDMHSLNGMSDTELADTIEAVDAGSDRAPTAEPESPSISLLMPMDERNAKLFSSQQLTLESFASAITPPESPPKDEEIIPPAVLAALQAARRRKYRERNWDMMRDLTGLMHLLGAKYDELTSLHSLLSSASMALRTTSASSSTHLRRASTADSSVSGVSSTSGYTAAERFANLKSEYIHTSRDIYDISSNIVQSWSPVAKNCDDKTLALHLTRALTKVEALSLQLRTVTTRKENEPSDHDGQAQVLSCASNLVEASRGALQDLEAAKMRLGHDDDDILIVSTEEKTGRPLSKPVATVSPLIPMSNLSHQ
eukprot:jgi/Hompol1/5849/HPOL_004738-RA